MRRTACLMIGLYALGCLPALAQTTTEPNPIGPSDAIRLLPAPPKIKQSVPTVAKTLLKWMSPARDTLFFRPATITLDWSGPAPRGATYSVSLSDDGKTFDTLVAGGITETHVTWTLPDLPRTTLYLRVRAQAPGGAVTTSDVLRLHSVPADAIIVSKQNQRLWAFKDGMLEQRYLVSTGQMDHDTRAGWFSVYNREENHHSSLYDVDMPYALFFSGGQAIHSSTALRQLGTPASHGCVRLPRRHARTLFEGSAVGRPVIITDWREDMSWLDGVPKAAQGRRHSAGKPSPAPVSHPAQRP